MALLEIDNVSKSFRTGSGAGRREVRAVQGVSLSIGPGKCVGLVGESGCGKSTLANLILGIEEPDSGEIRYDGRVISGRKATRALRQQIQMIYQDSSDAVNYRKSIRQIVGEPLTNFAHLRGRALEDRVRQLLAAVDVPEEAMDKYPRQFSLGQLQRICIARALAAEPRLLIMDEPLSSLDVSVQAQILNMLEDLKVQRGISSLLISHDLEAVYYLSDSICVMYGGQLMETIGDIRDFFSMEHPYTRRLLASCPVYRDREERCPVEEVSLEDGRGGRGCPYAARCSCAEERCFAERPKLREIAPGHLLACHRTGGETIRNRGES